MIEHNFRNEKAVSLVPAVNVRLDVSYILPVIMVKMKLAGIKVCRRKLYLMLVRNTLQYFLLYLLGACISPC